MMNKKFWIPLLLHFVITWLILDRNFSLTHGNSLVLYYNFPNIVALLFRLIFVPLVDITYWYVFRKHSFFKSVCVAFAVGLFYRLSMIPFASLMSHWLYPQILEYVYLDIHSIIYLVGYITIYSTIRIYISKIFHNQEVQLQKTENELSVLKAQLNPHFLFNSLNYLYGTALAEKAERTSQSVMMLSEMMRYTITGATENLVPLHNELKFIKNYIYLQKARLPQKESIHIEIDIDDYEGNQKIAPLLLLPFIENAFKYGVSIDESCLIRVYVKISDIELKMQVVNSVNEPLDSSGNNTGIINTRKRLDLLYNNRYLLECNRTDTQYTVYLSVKIE